MVVIVVPVYVILTSTHGVIVVVKASWVIRLVLWRFELCFTEGIVITHPWSAVAGGDSKLAQQVQITVSGHRCASILMQSQAVGFNAVALIGLLNQLT